jgi:uncharacterized protein YjbI with pentapeptide repeats
VQRPDLPELEPLTLDRAAADEELVLDGVLVHGQPSQAFRAHRVQVSESELHGLTLEPEDLPGLRLSDVVLRGCDLSNSIGHDGALRRVEVHDSRLVGFGLSGAMIENLRVVESSLSFASLAFAQLRDCVFERVKLAEASFMEARLERVEFIDCELLGTDFRGVRLKDCTIRGTALDGVLGVEDLRGLSMPWPDVIASAAALAATIDISIEES